MTKKQSVLFSIAASLILSVLFFIVFSERGLADLSLMKKERDRMQAQNQQIVQENLTFGVEIDRLKYDLKYIESVARRDFGMIGQDEIVVKPQRPADR